MQAYGKPPKYLMGDILNPNERKAVRKALKAKERRQNRVYRYR